MKVRQPSRAEELARALAHAAGPGRDQPRPTTTGLGRSSRRGSIWRSCAAVARRVELDDGTGPRGRVGRQQVNACAGSDEVGT